jgi:hypothetical protein
LNLARQTLQGSPAKALAGLHYAQQYMRYGFTTLRDMGTLDRLDSEWPTINCAMPSTAAWLGARA